MHLLFYLDVNQSDSYTIIVSVYNLNFAYNLKFQQPDMQSLSKCSAVDMRKQFNRKQIVNIMCHKGNLDLYLLHARPCVRLSPYLWKNNILWLKILLKINDLPTYMILTFPVEITSVPR
jgi:hypothetical protein